MEIPKDPLTVQSEFTITSVSVLRNRDRLPEPLVQEHEARLQYAQSIFDQWGITLEETLNMPQEEFLQFVDRIV